MKLLTQLRQNARAPVTELARRIGLARTTVQARIERMEAGGIIAGYTLRGSAATRPPLRATVLVSIEPATILLVLFGGYALSGIADTWWQRRRRRAERREAKAAGSGDG